jgi:ABC-type transporter Mla subunit MlaD
MAVNDLTPQLRTRLSRVERIVGAFVLAATLLAAAGFSYYVYHLAERKGWFLVKARYFTFLRTGAGLQIGQPVKLMGFDVGWVTLIEAMPADDRTYDVYVEFILKEPYYGYIWSDSKCKVVADLFGGRYLEVTKGKADDARTAYAFDQKTMRLTGIWVKGNYQPIRPPNDKYWVPSDEAPALNERVENLARVIEAALPSFLNLTNQIATVLSNSAALTAHLDATVLDLRPTVNHLQVLTARLTNSGALGEWLLPTEVNAQLVQTLSAATTTLGASSQTLTNVDRSLIQLTQSLDLSLVNLANITSNLNAQVQSNDQILSQISSAIVQADTLMRGLKEHWLLRSAFKEKSTNTPSGRKTPTPPPRR